MGCHGYLCYMTGLKGGLARRGRGRNHFRKSWLFKFVTFLKGEIGSLISFVELSLLELICQYL